MWTLLLQESTPAPGPWLDLPTWLLATLVAAGLGLLVAIVLVVTRRREAAPGEPGAPAVETPLGRLRAGLSKTRGRIADTFRRLVGAGLREEDLDRVEEALIGADIGVETTTALVDDLREAWDEDEFEDSSELSDYLRQDLKDRLQRRSNELVEADEPPTVVVFCGVNGVGKTTSIAKLAWWLQEQGHSVLLGAGDTFRAAAVEQLTIWADELGVPIVKAETGADPGSVAFDATEAAVARGVDYLLFDTAGRLHTHGNLMRELSKVQRVIRKNVPTGPHEVLLVLDATTGQNALAQAEEFAGAIDVTGIFLAKLDGTAKGGIVIAVNETFAIPVKFIGVGESMEDLAPFDPDAFVDALFA